MIKIYSSSERLFNHNGLKIIHPTKCIVYKVDNGDYYVEIEDSIEDIEYLKEGNIVRVPTPWGEQGFRLKNPKITNKKISIKGKHLYFDSSRYAIVNSYVDSKNCNDALDHINNACDQETPFTTISDITTINSTRIVRNSLEEAISTILEKWGGHLDRDNWNIGIRNTIGQDRGVVIKYGKNIINVEAEEIWDSVVTKLLPVGYDGITLPETYLISDVQYDIPYTKIVHFDQEIDQEEFTDEDGNLDEEAYKNALITDLRSQAQIYLNENKYLKCNYVVNAQIDNVADVGDVIYVKHELCNIDLTTNVISLQYDVIAEKYIQIEFGNFKNELKNLISKINAETKENIRKENETTVVKLQDNLKDATSKIWGTLGDSNVIYDGDKVLVVDSLPKETAKNVIMINSQGIGFSQTGIHGTFNSAWLIDGTLDMQNINVINMVADIVKGGTLKVGSKINETGTIEIYDASNTLIGLINDDGITIFESDGKKIQLNGEIGFVGFDVDGNKLYWADGDEFHMRKSVVEEEITIANKVRILGMETDTNVGVGFVAMT